MLNYVKINLSKKFLDDDAEREKRQEMGDPAASPMGDFGGDYGDYLKLLEGNSALGFNPQADPIGDNQVYFNELVIKIS